MSYIQYRANKDAEWQELKHPISLVLKADTPTSNRDNVDYWWQYIAGTGVWDDKWSDDGSEYIGADVLEELEYPVGTHNVKNFGLMTNIVIYDTAGWFYTYSFIYVKKMLGTLDMSGATRCDSIPPVIYSLEDAGTIILPNPKNLTKKTTVYIGDSAPNLKEIRLVGVLDYEAINCKTSAVLSKESVISIINSLADTPSSGMATITLKTAVRNQFTNEEWEALVKSKPKWNISLV